MCVDASHARSESSQIAAVLQRCKGAYSESTLRGYAADLRSFQQWCESSGLKPLPSAPETVGAFVEAEAEFVAPSTLKRRLAAIRFAHRYADQPNPTCASDVQLAIRRATRRKPRRPNQALGLTFDVLQDIIAACPPDLAGGRDAALISVGYDTLCRSSELSAMRIEHLRRPRLGNWSVLVPRAKSDSAGDGRIAWLSSRTSSLLEQWLKRAGITDGPVFRSLHLARLADCGLDTCSIRRLVKRAAARAKISNPINGRLSGHSMRVGAAQDMLVAGFDTAAIMQAGGWKTPHVLLRYVENASTLAVHARRWEALEAQTQ